MVFLTQLKRDNKKVAPFLKFGNFDSRMYGCSNRIRIASEAGVFPSIEVK
jgi:hypothetical protein